MSDQRKLRSDARQGFHQFAMHLYQSYMQTHDEAEAKKLVAESINEQLRLFMGSDASHGDIREVFNAKITELEKDRSGTNEYDEQMYYDEQIHVLEKALEVLGIA